LHFDKHVLAKAIEDDSLYWRLQMFCRIPTDNLTVIDFDDKVRRYDTVGQLITNFVNWRLKFYDIRKQHQIANIEQEIAKCIDISKFIDLILNEVIVLHKQSSKDVKQILTDNNISHEVLKIAVSRLTKDEQKKLADTIKTLKRSKKEIEQSNIVDTYYAEVESLKQTLLDNGYELPEVRHVTI
jgi:DNA topoisomerase-2